MTEQHKNPDAEADVSGTPASDAPAAPVHAPADDPDAQIEVGLLSCKALRDSLHGSLSLNDKCVALIISLSIVVPQECLLSGLHSVSDGELPMIASDFYAKHVLPAKAEGTALHSFATGYVVSPVKNSDMHGVWLQEQALISRKLPTRSSQSYFQPLKRRSAQTNCIEACALQCMPPFHTISWTRLHRQSCCRDF